MQERVSGRTSLESRGDLRGGGAVALDTGFLFCIFCIYSQLWKKWDISPKLQDEIQTESLGLSKLRVS